MSSSRKTNPKGSERFNLRLEAPLKTRLTEAATKAGVATVSAYVRHILMREVDGQSSGRQMTTWSTRPSRPSNRPSLEVHQLRVQHMATWSLVDALTKAFFTCVPEQSMRTQRPATLRELERNVGN